eukprot:12348219-Alexandrium_andersonii.AAC.1
MAHTQGPLRKAKESTACVGIEAQSETANPTQLCKPLPGRQGCSLVERLAPGRAQHVPAGHCGAH